MARIKFITFTTSFESEQPRAICAIKRTSGTPKKEESPPG